MLDDKASVVSLRDMTSAALMTLIADEIWSVVAGRRVAVTTTSSNSVLCVTASAGQAMTDAKTHAGK